MNRAPDDASTTILITPYSHPDWAWTHTRCWHEHRYVLALEEALDVLNQQDRKNIAPEAPEAFRFYLDVYKTQLEPFLLRRPERVDELRRRVSEGRIAVCGGYSNVRINHVEGETFVRSLTLGRRAWRAVFPQVDLSVHADLVDVAVGHPQLPQLLRQAGCTAYRFWRPQTALTIKGVPYHFIWHGLDGSTVLCSRGCYGGLATRDFVPDDFGRRWSEVMQTWERHELSHHREHSPVPLLWLYQGADDNRPLHTHKHDDRRLDFPSFIAEWNRREASRMRFATPVEAFAELERYRSRLPAWHGTLDPCDVCYNAAWAGSRGLWRLRSEGARALLTAETAAVAAGADYPSEELDRLWRQELLVSAHATQWLFQEDFDQIDGLARDALDGARTLQQRALQRLASQSDVPGDAAAFVFNPLPFTRSALVNVHLTDVDGETGGLTETPQLVDAEGAPAPCTVTEEFRHGRHCWEQKTVARVSLPPMGWTWLRPGAAAVADSLPALTAREEGARITLDNESLTVELQHGRMVCIRDKLNGLEWLAPLELPFGHLRFYDVDTSARLHVGPILGHRDIAWEAWEVDESRLPLWVSARVRGAPQTELEFRLFAGEPRLECRLAFDWPGGDGFAAVHVPVPSGAELSGDMPFCVEAKDLSAEPYGVDAGIERQRRGVFLAQSFVSWCDGKRGMTYISHDGDRYFTHDPDERVVRHILVNSFTPSPGSWEEKINRQMRGAGHHAFTFSLLPHAGDWRAAHVWRTAQSLRTPPVTIESLTAGCGVRQQRSLMAVEPDHVVMSACYRDRNRVLVRVYETCGQPADLRLSLAIPFSDAYAVDLHGDRSEHTVSTGDGHICAHMRPWEILTIAIETNP